MTGDDIAVLADPDRVGEADGADAAGDLGDLRLTVGAGIPGVGRQPRQRPVLDDERVLAFWFAVIVSVIGLPQCRRSRPPTTALAA
ncbi:MAG: hypothetical protein U1E56_04105 [Bauldia sp.]